MTDAGPAAKGEKYPVTLYLHRDVVGALDAIAAAQRRSRSWIANEALAEKVGAINAMGGEDEGDHDTTA